MRLQQALLALVILGGWAAPGRANDLVVIASSDPSVELGAVIDGSRSMSVAANASVVLVSSAGRTIKVTGPFHGAPDVSDSGSEGRLTESLSRLIATDTASTTKLAASRGGAKTAPANRPDIWGIDVARTGNYCLRPDRAVMLWWDAARSGAIVSISRAGHTSSGVRIRWPSGKRHHSWPAELALSDHATYVARFRSNDSGEELVTIMMPNLDTDAHRAAWMSEHGCTLQALKVLDALAREALRSQP
jgi:hypothetical protein